MQMFKNPLRAVIHPAGPWGEAKPKQIGDPEFVPLLKQGHQAAKFQHRTVKTMQQQ